MIRKGVGSFEISIGLIGADDKGSPGSLRTMAGVHLTK
jgi:hypothetical protein